MSFKNKLILTVILLSYGVTAMDGAVVITGLEMIAHDLGLGPSALSWVQNAYMLAWGGFMLTGGNLSDTFGRRCIMILSLCLFGISSLVAGMATTDVVLISARFVQGIGAALLAPTALALIVDCFKGMERVKAIAWYSSISGLGLSVGLVAGGVIAGLWSWRYGFFVNIPVILLMLAISAKVLDRKAPAGNRKPVHFDIAGTALSVAGIVIVVYAVNGATSPLLWLAAGLIILWLFVYREKHTEAAMMPLRLFNADRSRAHIARMLFTGSMTGFYFFISEYLQEQMHLQPLWIGVAFLPLTLSTFYGAIKVPGAVRRFGNMRVLFSGQMLMLTGFTMMTALGRSGNYWTELAIPMIVLGFGQGFTMSPLTNLGMAGVRAEDNGVASGIVNAAHQTGCSVGLSIIVAVTARSADIVYTCHTAMLTGLVFTILSFTILFFRRKYARKSFSLLKIWKQSM